MQLCLAMVLVASAAPRILTLDEAVAVAEAHQPQLAQAHAAAQAQDYQTTYYLSQMLPQLSGTAQYSRSTSNFAPSPGSLPRQISSQSASLSASDNYFSFGLTASQLIYDFGQLYYTYASNQATTAAMLASERSTHLSVVQQTRQNYFSARLKKGLLKVAHDTEDNQLRHRTQIEAYVEAGKRPQIDLLQARADFASAHLATINADANYLVAKAILNQTMGLEGDIDYEVGDDQLPPLPHEADGIDALLEEALVQRPDYVAAQRQITAQECALRSAMGAWGPTFSLSAGLTEAGEDIKNMAWNWRAGALMNWSIFGSGETWFTVQQNRWELTGLQAQRDGSRQQVRFDVEQARLQVASAKESVVAARDSFTNAKQLLDLAEGRYAAGLGNIIELGDAQLAYSTAAQQLEQSDYQLANARANLQKALGRD